MNVFHYSIVANFEIEYDTVKPQRREVFKLRDVNGLQQFWKMTNDSKKLKDCFKENFDLEDGCNKWYREIDSIMHQCFKKIKITTKPPKRTLDYAVFTKLLELKKLKEKIPTALPSYRPILLMEIERCERNIAEIQGEIIKKVIRRT